jgi:hypothetical protein
LFEALVGDELEQQPPAQRRRAPLLDAERSDLANLRPMPAVNTVQ